MGEHTEIGWTDHTWSPWWGCMKVSPACDNCYAEALDRRTGGAHWGADAPLKLMSDTHWRAPLNWNRKVPERETRFVFPSMCDPFDKKAPVELRQRFFDLIRATPSLTWLLLTKRIGNAVEMCEAVGGLPANAALGETIVTQDEAIRDVPKLLEAKRSLKARLVFLSIEPMLEEMDITDLHTDRHGDLNALTGRGIWPGAKGYEDSINATKVTLPKVDWVIVGGESGQNARKMDEAWPRAIAEQCFIHGTPFFFKQWGGRTPKANGKMLDGREWCERPRIAA